jgi:hypothetical protein
VNVKGDDSMVMVKEGAEAGRRINDFSDTQHPLLLGSPDSANPQSIKDKLEMISPHKYKWRGKNERFRGVK